MKMLMIGLASLFALAAPSAFAQDRPHGGYAQEERREAGAPRGGGFERGPSYGGPNYGSRGDRSPGYGRQDYGRPSYPVPDERRAYGGGFARQAPYRAPGGDPRGERGYVRGQFLPPSYGGAAVADPRVYHLRRPPNGYGWVTVGPNAYLTQRSTGLILDTAPLY